MPIGTIGNIYLTFLAIYVAFKLKVKYYAIWKAPIHLDAKIKILYLFTYMRNPVLCHGW